MDVAAKAPAAPKKFLRDIDCIVVSFIVLELWAERGKAARLAVRASL
jgi:hypothetical protein